MRIGLITLLLVIIAVLVSESAGRPQRNTKSRDLRRRLATISERWNESRRGFRNVHSGFRRSHKFKARKSNNRRRQSRKMNRRNRENRNQTSSDGMTTISPENTTFKQRIQSDPPNAICSFCQQNTFAEARDRCVKAFCSITRDKTAGSGTSKDNLGGASAT